MVMAVAGASKATDQSKPSKHGTSIGTWGMLGFQGMF